MSSSRRVGWLIVVLLLGGGALTAWRSPRPSPVIDFTEQQRQKLLALPEGSIPDWLTAFEDAMHRRTAAAQVLLLSVVPQEAPVVIALPVDSDGEELATHWRAPWPGVIEHLSAAPPVQPAVARSRQAGFDYAHHLFPVDADGERWLLVNVPVAAPRWTGLRLLAIVLGLLLAVALLIR